MPASGRRKLFPGVRRPRGVPPVPSTALTRLFWGRSVRSCGPRLASPAPEQRAPPDGALQGAEVAERSGRAVAEGACGESSSTTQTLVSSGSCLPPLVTSERRLLPLHPTHVEGPAILATSVPLPQSVSLPPLDPPRWENPGQHPHTISRAVQRTYPSIFCKGSDKTPLQFTSKPLEPPSALYGVIDTQLSTTTQLSTAITMPPKLVKSSSQKKHPSTPLPKKATWADPPDADGPSSPPIVRGSTQDAEWGHTSDSQSEGSDAGSSHPRDKRGWAQYLRQLPTKDDFKSLVAEVKEACKTEITALRKDLKHVSDRVETLETDHDDTRRYVTQLQSHITAQDKFLNDTRSHLEDIDNRGRRNNIRVRGIPEADNAEDLPSLLSSIFNQLLDATPDHVIQLDRAHRALRPKRSNGPSRDVICCVHDFALKERVMAAARSKKEIVFEGSTIQLFPDLAWITLQRRRHLKPLISLLRSQNVTYRWGFPFSLTAMHDGKSAVLRTHADLPAFCSTLGVDPPHLPDWDMSLFPSAPPPAWQPVQQKRRRQPSRSSPPTFTERGSADVT